MSTDRRSWRQYELLRESLANVLDPRSRHALTIGAAAVLGLSLSFLLVQEWSGLKHDLAELRANGRNVILLAASDPGAEIRISTTSCSALADIPGVIRAGSVFADEARGFVQLGPLVPVVEVSPDLLPALRDHAAVIGSALTAATGTLAIQEQPSGQVIRATIAGPEPSGMAGLNSSLAIPLPGWRTWTDTCVAELSPFADAQAMTPLLEAGLETTGSELAGTPILRESYDVLGAYRGRVVLFLPVAVGLMGAALGVILLRTRSSELAAYRLSGTSRADLASLLLWEQLTTAGAFVAFGGLGLLLQGLIGRTPAPDDFLWIWVAGLAWMTAFGVVAVLGLRGSPADLARDR